MTFRTVRSGSTARRAVLAFTALVAAALNLSARVTLVTSPDELAAALHHAAPGDVITLRNGTWDSLRIAPQAGGTADAPLQIRAETGGGVRLTGNSQLELDAPYITVSGLLFTRGAIERGAVIQLNSRHGIVRETAIIDYNPPSFRTPYYWVFFAGDDNTVDHCYFEGKTNLGPLVGNALEGSRRNAVTRCFFRRIPYAAHNGREILRIWGAGKFESADNDGAYFKIEENLFDHADGEGAEIISLKSNHNVVRRNTIVASRGCVNIRRGDYNTIEDNIILGQHRDRTLGLRMSGEHNVIQGNLVAGCEYGIEVSSGEFIAGSLTPRFKADMKRDRANRNDIRVPTYPQNRDDLIARNVLVDNSGPDLDIGASYKRHWPASQQVLLPEACQINDNRLVRFDGGASVVGAVPDDQPPLDRLHFGPNFYRGNVLLGGTITYAAAAAGFARRPLPPGWSPEREQAAFKPLTAADVGPSWLETLRRPTPGPAMPPAVHPE